MEPIQIAIAVVGALLAAVVGFLFGKGPKTPEVIAPPGAEHSANEVENDDEDDKSNAVAVVADAVGVDPSVLADDLNWLRPDDDV